MVAKRLQEAFAAHIRQMPFFSFPDVSYHASGYSNLVFKAVSDDVPYAVRFSKGAALKPSVFVQYDYERTVWKKIARLDLSPKIFSSGIVSIAGKKFPYSIQQFLGGRPLEVSRDLPALARSLARLHAGTTASAAGLHRTGDVMKWAGRQLDFYSKKSYSQVSPDNRRLLLAAAGNSRRLLAPTQSCAPVLVHNDLVADNVIVEQGKVAFIDWGWAMHSSPAIDLACAVSPWVTSWKKPYFVSAQKARTFASTYAASLSPKSRKALADDVSGLWDAYNVMVAQWIVCDYAPQARSLSGRAWFSDARFLKSALKHSETLKPALLAGLE